MELVRNSCKPQGRVLGSVVGYSICYCALCESLGANKYDWILHKKAATVSHRFFLVPLSAY